MTEIQFGSATEFVRIGLPASYSTEGWARGNVEIAVNGFAGSIQPHFEARDLENFALQLRALYDALKGEALLEPLERQITLKFEAQTGGRILLTGIAWSGASYENKLAFRLEMDQSYLPAPLQALEALAQELGRTSS